MVDRLAVEPAGLSHFVGEPRVGDIDLDSTAGFVKQLEQTDLGNLLDMPNDELMQAGNGTGDLGAWVAVAGAMRGHLSQRSPTSYFAWELEPVDDTVRIRTDLAAVSEDAAYGSTHDVYGLWPRLRCPVLLVRAGRPVAPGGGLVVPRADAERFAAEARDATVVDVDTDHYSILISPRAISAVERFVGAGAA